MEIFCIVIMCILWLFGVYVNDSWYKECRKLNNDWYNYCGKTVGSLTDTIDEYDTERKKISDILHDSTKSDQEKVHEIRQIIPEFEEDILCHQKQQQL